MTTKNLSRLGPKFHLKFYFRFQSIFVLLFSLTLFFTAFAVSALPAQGGTPEDAPYQWVQIDGRWDNPLYLGHAGDGSGRIFVVEQAGFIWVVQNDQFVEEPFLDISELVTDDTFRGGYTERGLLGLVFHPQYTENGVFFIYYIDRENYAVLARYRVSDADTNRADPASAATVLRFADPAPDHNGGMLAFGADGYLYLSVGDGGTPQGDPEDDAQNLGSYLGKIHRLDVDPDNTDDFDGFTYSIPADNPFVGQEAALPEIWAYGLRNPWRFSFDRETSDLYIADVGWGNWEEISYVEGGAASGMNFGWNRFEGTHRVNGHLAEPEGAVMPVWEYDHTTGDCSITGGYVYRGSALPELAGRYFFGDYCTGNVWTLQREGDTWNAELFSETGRQISSFGEDEQGELYLVDYKGFVLRLEASRQE